VSSDQFVRREQAQWLHVTFSDMCVCYERVVLARPIQVDYTLYFILYRSAYTSGIILYTLYFILYNLSLGLRKREECHSIARASQGCGLATLIAVLRVLRSPPRHRQS